MKYKCACCGYYTLKDIPNDTQEICPVCFWSEDLAQFLDPNLQDGENNVSLNTARENFKKYKAAEERLVQYVREPKFEERIGLEEYGERYPHKN